MQIFVAMSMTESTKLFERLKFRSLLKRVALASITIILGKVLPIMDSLFFRCPVCDKEIVVSVDQIPRNIGLESFIESINQVIYL